MIAARLVEQLTQRGWSVAAAESCTGGMIASALTEVPGSSAVFRYGVVTYANEAKTRLLGVPPEVFIADGAVSESCARAMLIGLRELAQAELCCAVTGIAGPGGDPQRSLWAPSGWGWARWSAAGSSGITSKGAARRYAPRRASSSSGG